MELMHNHNSVKKGPLHIESAFNDIGALYANLENTKHCKKVVSLYADIIRDIASRDPRIKSDMSDQEVVDLYDNELFREYH